MMSRYFASIILGSKLVLSEGTETPGIFELVLQNRAPILATTVCFDCEKVFKGLHEFLNKSI